MELTHQEELRYNRQIVLKDIDFDGQETLKSSKMLIVGLGGLGCTASQYLAVAGVGYLTLLDFDTVDLVQFTTPSVARRQPPWYAESGIGEALPATFKSTY